jgi:hypothetical protein
MPIYKLRHSSIYNVFLLGVALSGVTYILWKLLIANLTEVDFKFVWLAGVVWAKGGDPYSFMYASTAQEMFKGIDTNMPQFWFYGPNWWPISRALAAFELSTATQIWRLSIVALITLGCVLFYRTSRLFGQSISRIELAGFAGVVFLMDASAITISIGQTSAIVYSGLGALALGLASNQRFLITIGVILLLLKPQIGLALVPALIIYRASRFAVVIGILVTCLMAVPSLVGHDLATMTREFVAQAAIHGKQPSNSPLETTGLRHVLYALTGLTISSLSTTVLATMLISGGTFALRMNIAADDRMSVNAINVWLFFSIASIGCIVSLHIYDLIFMAPLLLLSSSFNISVQFLTWLGFVVIFRSGNLAHLFGPKTPDEQLSISAALDTAGAILMFFAGFVGIFLRSKLQKRERREVQGAPIV